MSTIAANKEKIKVRIIFFGPLKDYFAPEKEMEFDAHTNIRTIMETLVSENSEAEPIFRASRAAIRDEFVELSRIILEGDEIYFLPPASGG